VRLSALFLWLSTQAAFAASEGSGVGRLDFADTPAFHSVVEYNVSRPVEAQRASGVSAKLRIAMWASGSALPARRESLEAIPPSALPAVRPSETITAENVQSASLEESSTAQQSAHRKRLKRRVFVEQPEIYDDGPSFLDYQRRALSNRTDLDDADSASEDAQPSFLGRPENAKPSEDGGGAQPSLLGRIFGALLPW
jgi:hypothetical protein